ncbi:MAG: pantetheine-phosphate adenylyltransferase [Alistipes sp.]|nr:pantetheine-phosphate adenylyltransferase [Candidatus Alistipes equi]
MTVIALFPGSFDPFTKGHEYIVDSALEMFDRVVIAVGSNISKNGLLSVENRIRLIEEIYKTNSRVKVASYSTLTGEFAINCEASVIVRGLRNEADYTFEHNIEAVNRILFPSIKTIFLSTPPELVHISSSVIKELHSFGHDVSEFLPNGIDINKYLL